MTKPVTYYAQNEAIDSLMEKYGSSLERMTRLDKLFLLAMITETLADGEFGFQFPFCTRLDPSFVLACETIVNSVPRRELTGLMLAITAQLHDKVYAEAT